MPTSPASHVQLKSSPPKSDSSPAIELTIDDENIKVVPREDARLWYYGFPLTLQPIAVSYNSEPLPSIRPRPKKGHWPLDKADAERFAPAKDEVIAAIQATLPQTIKLCISEIGYSRDTAPPVCLVLVRPRLTNGRDAVQMITDVTDILHSHDLQDFVVEVAQPIRESFAQEGGNVAEMCRPVQ